ncbi:HD domain-containing protein [Shewanella mesophila]|uniref:HD domain-containing protein n=1 Tax=Shewanella mesophila TaxID=2864208 RepID=UPI0021AD1C45|nr:HD domain-containing protein [Shewanella mesophila]
MDAFEMLFSEYLVKEMQTDPAHDLLHIRRVVKSAKALCAQEQACLDVVLPAAWLHDCLSLPKNHLQHTQSSRLAADKAIEYLAAIRYPQRYFEQIHHAIAAHSFSAKVEPQTIEAKIVQDADRLDALGAIGIARCLQVGISLNRPLYCQDDPFCELRAPDDHSYTLDHFYQKLLTLPELMQTTSAKAEALKRLELMKLFLGQLVDEI